MLDREAEALLEDNLHRLSRRELEHLIVSTNCARDFVRNWRGLLVRTGDCDECLRIAKRVGLKEGD